MSARSRSCPHGYWATYCDRCDAVPFEAAQQAGLAAECAVLRAERDRQEATIAAAAALVEKLSHFTKSASFVIDPMRPSFTEAERRAVDAARRRRPESFAAALALAPPGTRGGDQ